MDRYLLREIKIKLLAKQIKTAEYWNRSKSCFWGIVLEYC